MPSPHPVAERLRALASGSALAAIGCFRRPKPSDGAGTLASHLGISWAVRANAGESGPPGFHWRAPCRSLSTSAASSCRSKRRCAKVTCGFRHGTRSRPAGALPAPDHRGSAGVSGRCRAAARWGRCQGHPDRSGRLCGHARAQPVGGGQLPADDGKHHRERPRQGPGLWHEGARRQRPAGWRAGGIGADGAARGALAAARRAAADPGCRCRPVHLDTAGRWPCAAGP